MQSIKTKTNKFGKGIDVTGFVCGVYGQCRSTLLRYERATCFLCTFLHSILAWQSCLRPCQKDTVSNRRRRTSPSLRTALEWIQKIGNNSRDFVIPVSGRGIMMAVFDGNKAEKAVRRVSCEIDVMSVAHTNLSSFQKNADVILQKVSNPAHGLFWFCPHLVLTRFQNMSRACYKSNCGIFSST